MTRVAFTLISGKVWTGGYNYLLNLLRMLEQHEPGRISPVVFTNGAESDTELVPFRQIPSLRIAVSDAFDERRIRSGLLSAVVTGIDQGAAAAFARERVDLVFEPAQFYGWRLPMPALAWIPDFQHRYLRHLFRADQYWRREFGYRTQVVAGRHVLLSSEDARRDCEAAYPRSRGRTHVVRFACPPPVPADEGALVATLASYGLPERFYYLPNQFWRHKNHLVVIEALALLRKGGRPVTVVASGNPSDALDPGHFNFLQARARELGVESDLRLVGLVPRAHVTALLQRCTAMINPSLFEGWSTTVEEAKAAGTPMLLSDLRVHREQSPRNAWFFDPADASALARLLRDFEPMPADARTEAVGRAAAEAMTACRQFAADFADVAERVATRA